MIEIPQNVDIVDNATAEGVGYEPKGYNLHDEVILSCPSCNQKLVSVLVVKKDCPCMIGAYGDINKLKVRAKCLKCNMLTFVKVFERCKIFYQGIAPKGVTNINIDEPTGSVLLEVK